jgi:2-polyprenyl-3-methyl-5-hydroxy-6-metoxy-1,4-benzoquinol methylase
MTPELLVRLLKNWKPQSILEIGTGYGVMAHYFSHRYPEARVLGVDLNEKRIVTAQATVKGRSGIEFRHENILTLPEESYDLLVMQDVIHHVGLGNQELLIAKTWRLLRPGGRLLLRDIDGDRLVGTFNAFIWDLVLNWERCHFVAKASLQAMFSKAGYKHVEVFPDYPHSPIFPYVTCIAHKENHAVTE